MFNTISWSSYWTTLALLIAGYYLAIYLLYFRHDFNIRIHRKVPGNGSPYSEPATHQERHTHHPAHPSLFDEETAQDFQLPETGSAEGVVYSCMDELTAFFVEAKRRKWAKEEMVQALRSILLKYPSLKSSDYKDSLSRVIVNQCEHHCSIHLNEEDSARVW